MLTYSLQWLTAVELAAVAMFSLLAARVGAASSWHATGWRLNGVAWTVFVADLVTQLTFGGAAMAGGQGTPVMDAYLKVLSAFNHSRTFLMAGVMVMLLALGLMRSNPTRGFGVWAAVLMGAGLLLGAAAGLAEGGFLYSVHFAAVAAGDVAELLLLMATLFVLLLTNRVDRYLWALLATYACSLALGIFWFALFSLIGMPDTWHPPLWSLNVMWSVIYAAMAYLAFRRWQLGRAGRAPPYGMLGPQRPQLSMIG